MRAAPELRRFAQGCPVHAEAAPRRDKTLYRTDGMTPKPCSTPDRILDAAIGLMNKKGYNPVTIREIAKAVGLSEMTVFRHFPSKYAMLMAAMRRTPYTEMIEEVFSTHVCWDLERDLRH